MNRRQLLAALVGTPVVAASAMTLASEGDVVLAPGAVRIPVSVWDEGRGRRFSLTLLTKPWPLAGDRVRLDFQGLHLLGVVDRTEAESFNGRTGRCWYHVVGRVVSFEAPAVKPLVVKW
jgi:hypothetical protein